MEGSLEPIPGHHPRDSHAAGQVGAGACISNQFPVLQAAGVGAAGGEEGPGSVEHREALVSRRKAEGRGNIYPVSFHPVWLWYSVEARF